VYVDRRVRVIPSRLLAENALRIASAEGQSTYDCLYLALAVQARCQLITADERLIKTIKNKSLKQHLISLHDPALELELAG
jgi:predicted nucleic acid-binding protein